MSRSPESGPQVVRVEDLPGTLWAEARAATQRLLLIDYDGTLAPFRINPLEAVPHPGAARCLERIVAAGRTRIAVISGRPIHELRRLISVDGITLVGEHGWEIWSPGAGLILHPLPAGGAAALHEVALAARQEPWGRRLEVKRTSLVLHARGVPAEEASLAERAFGDLWRSSEKNVNLRLQTIDGGVELRAMDRDKGCAVREILSSSPSDAWVLYLGDEWTDEDGFRALEGRGVGIRVGPVERLSYAQYRVSGPPEVAEFLRRWIDSVDGPTGAERAT